MKISEKTKEKWNKNVFTKFTEGSLLQDIKQQKIMDNKEGKKTMTKNKYSRVKLLRYLGQIRFFWNKLKREIRLRKIKA